MSHSLSIATASRLLRRFGGQVAMSIAVSAGVAGVWAAPNLVFPQKAKLIALAPAEPAQTSAWLLAVPPDGKIGDRHRAADDDGGEARHAGLIAPAALVMPMSMGWSQPVAAEPVRIAVAVPEKAVHLSVAEIVPVRRPATPSERPKPVQIAAAPVVAAPSPAGVGGVSADPVTPEPTLLGRVVYEPVARATTIMSGAADMVGTAGSWTVTQAASLLPRW